MEATEQPAPAPRGNVEPRPHQDSCNVRDPAKPLPHCGARIRWIYGHLRGWGHSLTVQDANLCIPVPRASRQPPYLPQVDALSNPSQDVEPVGRSRQAGHRPRAYDLLLELVLQAERTQWLFSTAWSAGGREKQDPGSAEIRPWEKRQLRQRPMCCGCLRLRSVLNPHQHCYGSEIQWQRGR